MRAVLSAVSPPPRELVVMTPSESSITSTSRDGERPVAEAVPITPSSRDSAVWRGRHPHHRVAGADKETAVALRYVEMLSVVPASSERWKTLIALVGRVAPEFSVAIAGCARGG
jgi:hypothetical protein